MSTARFNNQQPQPLLLVALDPGVPGPGAVEPGVALRVEHSNSLSAFTGHFLAPWQSSKHLGGAGKCLLNPAEL